MRDEIILKKKYEGLKFDIKYPVLDIGGADGAFLRTQGVIKADIIDLGCHNNKFNYIKKDITRKLNIKDKYKTIFIMETLEHIKNPLYLISQVFDLLEDDGKLFISIPFTEIAEGHHHVNRWTKKQILRELSQCGFSAEVIQKRKRFKGLGFFLPHCWLVIRAKKRLNNKGGDWNN